MSFYIRIEEILQQKAERLQKRLDELSAEGTKKEVKRQQEVKRRQLVIVKLHEDVRIVISNFYLYNLSALTFNYKKVPCRVFYYGFIVDSIHSIMSVCY